MEWLRWYDGTISDAKWSIVALKAKSNIGAVVSVWAAMLEYASRHEDRGSLAGFDGETIDALFGYELGTSAAIFAAMKEKEIITEDNRIAAWSKRQFDEQNAEKVRRYRERQKSATEQSRTDTPAKCDRNAPDTIPTPYRHHTDTIPTPSDTPDTDTDTDSDTEADKKIIFTSLTGRVPQPQKIPDCPCEEIAAAYNDTLPELLPVQKLTDARKKALKARWREDKDRQTVEWWRRYFEQVKVSGFLTGKDSKKDNPWQADFDWLLKPANLQKVIEGKYNNHTRAAPHLSYEEAARKFSFLGIKLDEPEAVEVQAEEAFI